MGAVAAVNAIVRPAKRKGRRVSERERLGKGEKGFRRFELRTATYSLKKGAGAVQWFMDIFTYSVIH